MCYCHSDRRDKGGGWTKSGINNYQVYSHQHIYTMFHFLWEGVWGGGAVRASTEPESAGSWPPDQLTCCPGKHCAPSRNLQHTQWCLQLMSNSLFLCCLQTHTHRHLVPLTVASPQTGLDPRTFSDQNGEVWVGFLQIHIVLLHEVSARPHNHIFSQITLCVRVCSDGRGAHNICVTSKTCRDVKLQSQTSPCSYSLIRISSSLPGLGEVYRLIQVRGQQGDIYDLEDRGPRGPVGHPCTTNLTWVFLLALAVMSQVVNNCQQFRSVGLAAASR